MRSSVWKRGKSGNPRITSIELITLNRSDLEQLESALYLCVTFVYASKHVGQQYLILRFDL